MRRLLLLISLFFIVSENILASQAEVSKLPDGVLIHFEGMDKPLTWLRLRFISERIVRVSATPADSLDVQKRLIAEESERLYTKVHVKEFPGERVEVFSSLLRVSVSLRTGEVGFFDPDGTPVLQEQKGGGKLFEAISVDGTKGFTMQQIFDSPGEEAIYGLGQHQAHDMNYKGKSEELFQYNTKVSVPFMVSTRNYGLLWDNYSLSRYGDPRPYGQISQLNLYDDQGVQGSLTATYARTDGSVMARRREQTIDYENLTTVRNFPQGVNLSNATVTWTGWVEAPAEGLYRFLLYYAGYARVKLGDEWVMEERWRTAWNPSVAKFEAMLKPGVRVPVRIEWHPDGGTSYLGLKLHTPVPEPELQNLSFWSEMGDQIDYYFIRGSSMDEVIGGYRKITGKATIMPRWSLGYWQSRERYKTQDELLSTVKAFRDKKIPLDNIVLDWFYWKEDQWGSHEFDSIRFPNPLQMIRAVHDDFHAHIMISVWPKFYTGTAHYDEFDNKGWIYKQAVNDKIRDWVGRGYVGSFYDAYNPDARGLFFKQMNEHLLPKGIDAWWLDATEPDIQSNSSMEYRKALMNPTALGPSAQYFNAFALMNAKGIYEGQRSVDNDKRVFILTRSGFAGLQRYAAATWSGDIATRWEDMRAQITAGLNFSMSGLPYWTMDIGGFCVEKRYEQVKEGSADMEEWRELNVRWFQFGAFCPLFRAHGQIPYREPFNLFPEQHPGYKAVVDVIRLRYSLMPYIYSLAGETWLNDYTIMRGLAMDFPGDNHVFDIQDQYMFGPSVMVCPVTEYQVRERKVYFPMNAGWYDLYSGTFRRGGVSEQVQAPLGQVPLFVPAGSILPMGPDIQYTGERPADTLMLFVYTGADASFSLYEDEGTTYEYEKGAYSVIPMHYDDASGILTIGKRQGDFEGMSLKRVFRVVRVGEDKPVGFGRGITFDREVSYGGKSVKVSLK